MSLSATLASCQQSNLFSSCSTRTRIPPSPARSYRVVRYYVFRASSTNNNLPNPTGSAIPQPEEDAEVMHSAFMHAFQEAKPEKARIPGMQEFAAALLSRARIPSQQYTDPLKHIFEEFDVNGDGILESHEVGEALRSRNVNITDDQVQMFIDAVDLSNRHQVHESEFRDLILHMAAADLHSRRLMHDKEGAGDWVRCTLESDDEIQIRLKSWIDHIMLRRYR